MKKHRIILLVWLIISTTVQAGGIVSLLPSLTDIVVDLNSEDQLTGVTSFCIIPDSCTAETLGGVLDTNIEKIIRMAPERVLAHPTSEPRLKTLEKAGIQVSYIGIDTFSEIITAYRQLGNILGKQKLADKRIEELQTLIQSAAPIKPTSLKGLIVMNSRSLDTDNILTVGQGTYYSEIMKLCGIQNCVDTDILYPSYNTEALLKLNPDIILIITDIDLKVDFCSKQSFSLLNACKQNRVFTIKGKTVLHPGPSLFFVVKEIRTHMHHL